MDKFIKFGVVVEYLRNRSDEARECGHEETYFDLLTIINGLDSLPSAQPEGWMERNKERILQAGMERREIEFRIGGRLFAIREKAQ